MTENRNTLHKYAMLFGTYMGVFWICKFILFPVGLRIPFLLLPFFVLSLSVPFLGYYYVRLYRNKICNGTIGFFPAWAFTVFLYMFASLLVAVAHYIYFQFLDHGFILSYYLDVIKEMKAMNKPGTAESIRQLEEMFIMVGNLSPIELTMQLISQDVLLGSLFAIPTALFVMRKKKSNGVNTPVTNESNNL